MAFLRFLRACGHAVLLAFLVPLWLLGQFTPPPFNYAVYASGSGCGAISMSGGAYTDSFDSGRGSYSQTKQNTGGNVGVTGNINLSGGSIINGTISALNIKVGSCVKGTPGITLSGGAQATGGYVQLSAPLSFPNPPPVTPGSKDYNLTSSASLPPGSYHNITVSGGATLSLSAGTYNVNSIALSGNSILAFNGKGQLILNAAGNQVSQPFNFSGGSISNPSGVPINFELIYAGTQPNTLSGGTMSYAVAYMPNAPVTLSGGQAWYGAMVVGTLNDSGGSLIHFDRSLMPVLVSVNPNSGQQGQQGLGVTLTGKSTGWAQGTTSASFGAGIIVASLTVTSPTNATASINIDPASTTGARTVTMTTGSEVETLASGFTVNPGTPVLLSVNPNAGQQGQLSEPVSITGQFTHFAQGTTTASFGAGITVASMTVSSATSATAVINIDPAAPTGARAVTMTTGSETATLSNAFTVVAGTPVLLSVNPNSGQQGQQNLPVALAGQFTYWVQGTTTASFGAGITVASLTVNSASSATAVLNVSSTATTGARNVTLTTGSEVDALTNGFTVTAGTPVLLSASPNNGQQGQQNLSVALMGQFTHWVQGTTTASFGAGITVASLTVSSATSATAVVNIDPAASVGSRTVTLTTGTEVVNLTNGFSVTAGTPVLLSASPNNGQQGQQNLSVALTGQFTHWAAGTTTASFGAGITVASLSVSSATSATAVVSIDPAASVGSRTVTLATGTEVVNLTNGFSVTAGTPVLLSASPNSGQQGQQNLSVALTGQFTHWVAGTTTASFGAGITAASLSVNSTTSATAVLNIDPVASLGSRSVTLTTGTEVVNLTNGFSVTAGTPVLLSASPNSGQQGQQNLSVSITGQFTHFAQATTTASFGTGITVASLTVNSATSATAVVTIDPAAATGARSVTLTTGTEVATLANGFTVTAGTPVLVSVNPNSGQQGQQNLSVALTGQFTSWVQGTTTASFGAGITVASLTVNSTTSGTAVISIDPAAATGTRTVTLTTGSEVATLANGFAVAAGTPVLTTVNPNTGQQGQQNLSISITGQFTHFAQGTTTASFGTGITVASLTVNSATSATAVVTIDPAAATGARTVTLTTGTEVATLANGFTVSAGTPVLTTVNPNTGQQGQQNVSVSITGQFTHFAQGTTTASFGSGITGASLSVNSATSATAVVNIDPAASVGSRTVTLTTGTEVVNLANGFMVMAGTPALTAVNPNTGQQGQQNLSVNITGQFTHFAQGTSTVSFGAGITVASLTVNSATSATAVVNMDPTASVGSRTVTLTTGTEVVNLTGGFSVTAGTPVLLSASPNSGQQGQQNLSVALTGQFTHWAAGTTTASFGAGITVASLTVSSATSATAVLNIDPAASVGSRTVTLATGTEVVNLTNGFSVTAGTPVLLSASPNSGQQGQQNLSVALAGQFTNWVQGTTTANFGAGIAVGSLTVSSATSATAVLNISATAATGARNVTLTTGSEVDTLTNGFTVAPGTPVLVSVNPNNGQQGQQNLSVTLTGQFTSWAQGTTTASFGAGITVASLTVSSATSAAAVLNISSTAAMGARNVTLTTGSEVDTLTNGFTVTPGTPVLVSVNPNSGQQGQQNLSVTLTGQFTSWVQGTTTASFGAGIAVASLTVNSATSATAVLNITATATTGTRNVTLTTGTEVETLSNGFTVTPGTPVLVSVNPNTGQQGQQNLSVTLTGQFTSWAQGTTTASFGAGITVASLTVSSATSATAVVNISATATTGGRNVTLTTGSEVDTLTNGFTVTAGTPVLVSVSPNTGQQGQQNLSVNLTGQFTSWVQGTTTASFGAGITVASLTVNSVTSATAVLNISSTATTGARNVTLTTGSEVDTLTNGFTVTAPAPSITSICPSGGQPGQQNKSVTLFGDLTNWNQGTTTVSFGAGITVASLTVLTPTEATAVINIDAGAATGPRTVTTTTASEVETLANGFTVTALAVSPNAGQQGQKNLSVTFTGQFTNWIQGMTTAQFLGGGITVVSLTIISPASATAVLDLSSASPGPRTVKMTTGSCEVETNGFNVALLASVNPNTGQQGQQNLSVALTGQFTNWVQGVTTASFGAGITVASLTVNSSTSATAVLNIDSAAATGARAVTMTTGAEVETLPTGFVVTSSTPIILTVSPNSGQPGQLNLPVTITGQSTHFVQGTTTASFGPGITVVSLTVNSITSATAVIGIDGAAATGPRAVSVTTGSEVATLANAFNVVSRSVLASCVTGGSMSILLPAQGPGTVTAYLPNSPWRTDLFTGVQVVPVEGSGSPTQVPTPSPVNSCASNSVTGESICVGNNADIDLIQGSTLKTALKSGTTGSASGIGFSGGQCHNCGVTINSLSNTAVIQMALASAPSGSGIQFLNLDNNALGTPVPAAAFVSEDLQWDPIRNLILSPNELSVYDLFQTSSSSGTTSATEFSQTVTTAPGGMLDSAAEDCTTGIGLSSVEKHPDLFITDLTQAAFASGSPGSWTAPGQDVSFPEFQEFPTGTSGIAVPPGTHLAIVATEFASKLSNQFGVVALPTTSGSGTPSFGDYAAAALPPTPDGFPWFGGIDPHPVTAYVSPNNGRPYGVLANFAPINPAPGSIDGWVPTWLAVIDLQALLGAPRKPGIFPSGDPNCQASSSPPFPPCTHSVDPGYDLLANGVVTYVNPRSATLTLSPNTAQQGQTVLVTLTGQNTNWEPGAAPPGVAGTTSVDFGHDIGVGVAQVSSGKAAQVSITVSPTASVGPRLVAVTTRSNSGFGNPTEVDIPVNGFTVTPGTPVLLSVSPNAGQQGQQNISVSLTGQFTNWVQGTTTASFGAGITVASVTVSSPTTATAVLNIDLAAAIGPRTITMTTGPEVDTLANGFSVTGVTPVLVSVNPNTGQQGQPNLSVALTGQFTSWVQGTTTASFGAGITVASLTVNSATSSTAVLNISAAAATGSRTVTLTTASEVETLTNGFTVAAGTPALLTVNPGGGQQGQQNLSVALTGQFTHWVQGTTTVNFGAGITIASVTVSSATSATAIVNISSTATVGPRTVTVTTGSEIETLPGGFSVTAGTQGITSITPGSGQQGQQNLSVALTGQFTNWVQGTTTASFGSGITVASLTVSSATAATAAINIDAAATIGARAVTMTTGAEVETVPSGFSVSPGTPVLVSLNPASGQQGQQNLSVTLTGEFTNWTQGTTTASFGAGITVASLTVNSATSATATLNIAAAAATGSRTVTITAGSEVDALSNGFTVTAGTPVLVSVNPSAGQQGQQSLSVALAGQLTNWAQGTTTASFGAGITVISLTVNSATSATALLNISAAATPGPRTVAVTTGAEVDTLVNGFTVSPATTGPSIVSLSPNLALQGQALSVIITGLNTNFVQGMTVARFGPGVMVGTGVVGNFGPVTVTSPTTATAQITILRSALPGLRSVSVQTGTEQAGLANGFTVVGLPTLVGVLPNSGKQGQTISVAITGAFTNFVQGTTQASFGPGISVGGGPVGGFGPVTVTYAGGASAQLIIQSGATLGPRTVVAQTGAEQASAVNGFSVLGPVTGPPPTVTITSPAEASEVTGPATVTGTVTSTNLDTWTLDYQPAGASDFTTFATGTTSTVTGTFDPSLLLNGIVTIRLSATDTSGQAAVPVAVNVVVTRNLKIGNFTLSFNDLTVPVVGLPIQVIRTYDSRNKNIGDFGVGWTLGLRNVTLSKNVADGAQWLGEVGGTLLTYCIVTNMAHVVTVALPEGTTYEFQPALGPNNGCQQASPLGQVTITFTPTGNTPPNASLAIHGDNQPFVNGTFPGPLTLINSDSTTFDPDSYDLTLPGGRKLLVSRQAGLQSITDLNGNSLTVSAAGIVSSSGKGIAFTRDAQNRITQITDPAGNTLAYAYDSNGDLASFTDQLKNASTYAYDSNHDLLTFTDPRGVQPIRNDYDANGRLVDTVDAFGHVLNYTNDPNTKQEIVADRLGNVTVNEYDGDGNIVKETDALGGVTSRTFDSRDNKLSETNPLAQTRTYTYDANNNKLTDTDPLGDTTTYTYNSQNQVLTVTDALNHATTNTYDPKGNLLSTQDAAGSTTIYTYNAAGQQTLITDALGGVVSMQYDATGNLTQQTDALGNITTYTYDANGNKLTETKTRTTSSGQETLVTKYQYDGLNRLTQTTYPDGSTTQVQYNSIGKQSVTIDQLNRQTAYQYDLMGQLLQSTYPDGTKESSSYDAEGDRLTSTDRAGRVTTYTYDALKRLTATAYADSASTSTQYDSIGEVIGATDARGNVTQYQYDDAGRRVKVIDPLNHATGFAYDAVGNQTSVTDANGNATQYAYDNLNRRTQVTFPDSTTDVTTYDALGRTVSKADQAGKTTRFQYDTLGHLTQVTDALTQVTKYGYDELGNRTSQTDANGHTTTFAYDKLGRRTQRALPLGMTETYSYDLAGNLHTKTDFNGRTTTYAYDAVNRLTSKTPDSTFGAPTVSFTYTAAGQRQSMTDASGTTTYTYDLRDRLTQKATPEGTLAYTYDEAGNLTSIMSSNSGGTAVTYTFDQLNRLATVQDSHSGKTTYSYDTVGNLLGYAYANGVSTAYTYNTLNRLTNVTINNSKAQALASYAYTLGPAGNRTAVSELGGRQVNYSYDDLYRLTNETITGATTASNNGSIGYQYDPVGNRLQRTSSVGPVPPASYSYDSNDRLTSDTYDANGNTTASAGTAYTYDFENHLDSSNGGAVTIVYDGDGNRVAKTANGVTTSYLVDDRNLTGYAQVLEELSGGVVQRVYGYGLNRISQTQSTGTSFYGYDGHGSVRLLTDGTGSVTDKYDYDAFGTIISQSGSTLNVYLYSGDQVDPNVGFYYLRARYMIPGFGRFLTLDSDEGFDRDPRTLHKYLYTAGDPVNRIDPSGNQADLGELSIVEAIDASLQSIPGINAVTALCTAKTTLSAIATAAFITQLGILLPAALELNGFRPGFAFPIQSFDPTADITKFEARIFFVGSDTVLTLAFDTRTGGKIRFNVDLTNPGSQNTSAQVGVNFPLYSFKTCGIEVAKLEVTLRVTIPAGYSLGLEATILGRGKLAYTLPLPKLVPFY